MYPSDDVVRAYAEEHSDCGSPTYNRLSLDELSSEYLSQLRQNPEKDPIYEMHEQERKQFWALR